MGLSFGMLILHSELMPKTKKIHDRVTRYDYFKKWHPLKQTKTKSDTTFKDQLFMTRNFAFGSKNIPSL